MMGRTNQIKKLSTGEDCSTISLEKGYSGIVQWHGQAGVVHQAGLVDRVSSLSVKMIWLDSMSTRPMFFSSVASKGAVVHLFDLALLPSTAAAQGWRSSSISSTMA